MIRITGTILTIAAAMVGLGAQAQDYPTKPITIITPNPPGGATDPVARALAQYMTTKFGQQVIVEAKPGAAGTVAVNYVMKQAPTDGYTILLHTTNVTINQVFKKDIGYDVRKDFQPIIEAVFSPFLVSVNAEAKFKTLPELVSFAKANPGVLNYGSSGIGSTNHVPMEVFALQNGIKMTHVPFQGGGPTIVALLGKQIDLTLDPASNSKKQIDAGKFRGLAITDTKRSKLLPNIPTVAEAGLPPFVSGFFVGLSAPAATPPKIVQTLNAAMNEALTKPDVRQSLEALGFAIRGGSSAAFGKLMADQVDQWADVRKKVDIKME